MGVKYNSPEALEIAEYTMKFITDEARKMSHELGRARGSFPGFKESKWAKKYDAMWEISVGGAHYETPNIFQDSPVLFADGSDLALNTCLGSVVSIPQRRTIWRLAG